ncbi:tetratricopeptide repeat protein [Streptosporangium sp. NPDC020072]|uniref:tetratricopeptide repeat protein n=1 Tax=Streptosporangium sp. NPDC020072 TaxID=3154788 RepID=UPI00342268D3
MSTNTPPGPFEFISAGERAVTAHTISGIVSTGDNSTNLLVDGSVLVDPSQVSNVQRINNLPRMPTGKFIARRAELQVIAKPTGDRHTRLVAQVICGLGGVGKSELALRYATTRITEYSLIWWIVADSEDQIRSGFAQLACRLHPSVALTTTMDQASDWAIGWLQCNTNWLIILDNVEKLSHIKSILGQLSVGHILITSRRNIRWPVSDGIIKLDVFEPKDAQIMLAEAISSEAPEELDALAQIANELGYLPLALDQAAAFISQTQIPPDQYLSLLQEQPDQTYNAHGEERDSHETIGRLWDITLDTLSQQNRFALNLLYVLSWYAPDRIPRIILQPETSRLDFDKALGVLSSYSLINLRGEYVSMHRVLRSVLFHNVDGSEIAESLTVVALRLIKRVIPFDPISEVEAWPLLRSLLPHVKQIAAQKPWGLAEEEVADTFNTFGVFERTQGNFQSAKMLLSEALDIVTAQYGDSHRAILPVRTNYAAVLNDLGQYKESLLEAKDALRVAEQTLEEDSEDFLTISNNVAQVLASMGRLAEAEAELRKIVEKSSRLFGDRHPGTLASRVNLATVLQGLGRLREAADEIKRANSGFAEVLGEEHPDILYGRNNAATILHDLGKYEEAEDELRKTYEQTSKIFGEEHPRTLKVRDTLASMLLIKGLTLEAKEEFRKILKLRIEVLGESHSDTLTTLSNLASVLRELGEYEEAERNCRKAIALTAISLGEEHSETLTSRSNLANLLEETGRIAEAIAEIEETIRIKSAALGAMHPDTLRSRNNHAVMLARRGMFEEAERELIEVCAELSNTLGEISPLTLKARSNLSLIMCRLGHIDSAELEIVRALDGQIKVLGENHPDTLESFELRDHILKNKRRLLHGDIGRNSSCPCGSNRKYKRCCERPLNS